MTEFLLITSFNMFLLCVFGIAVFCACWVWDKAISHIMLMLHVKYEFFSWLRWRIENPKTKPTRDELDKTQP